MILFMDGSDVFKKRMYYGVGNVGFFISNWCGSAARGTGSSACSAALALERCSCKNVWMRSLLVCAGSRMNTGMGS
jgi:hypothetical protein